MTVFDEIKKTRREPVPVLHGTDWWTDCDDVAALRLLLRAHKAGLIELLGVGINSVMPFSAPSVSAMCDLEGVDVMIGVDRSAVRDAGRCRYQQPLAERFTHRIKSNDECPEAWKMYRAALVKSERKAAVIDVGFPQIIMQLLKSRPDELSGLDGIELVRQKVSQIWLMAGKWDEPDGKEYNLTAYPLCAEAGAYICENSPVPVTFLGFEVGKDVITGCGADPDDPLGVAFAALGFAGGRSSWDPMTALLAITGDPAAAGYSVVRGRARVDPATGVNNFTEDPDGPHRYVKKIRPDAWYADRINELL